MSKHYANLLIQINDQDGDVLLVFACDALPAWLNPETAQNRVFVVDGLLSIVPRRKDACRVAGDWPERIESVEQAIRLLGQHPQLCRASDAINATIGDFFAKYPEKIANNLHHCHCMLPANVAQLFTVHPQSVAAAVRSFHGRDIISMTSLNEQFLRPADELVKCRVRFTKLLYAMLVLDQFKPKRTSVFKLPETEHPLFKAYNIGLRLTYGVELLLHGANGSSNSKSDNVANSCGWKKFLNNLKTNGYFKEHKIGSADYEKLLEQAKTYYENEADVKEADKIGNLLQRCNDEVWRPIDDDEDQPDDDDSWLIVTNNDLNAVIGTDDWKTSRKAIKEEVNQFLLEEQSSYEGVDRKESSSGLNFTTEQFKESLRRVLDVPSDSECSFDDYDDSNESVDEEELQEMLNWSSEMKTYMAAMDEELASSSVGESFARAEKTSTENEDDIDLEDDNFMPVNVDKNLVSNLLRSYWSDGGQVGPAASLLHSLKLNPSRQPEPLDSDDENVEEKILKGMS